MRSMIGMCDKSPSDARGAVPTLRTFIRVVDSKSVMSLKVPSQAEYFDIGYDAVNIFYVIGQWMNDKVFEMGGERCRIATHKEPDLHELYSTINDPYPEETHQQLLNRGFLQRDWLWRQKIDWLPTSDGLHAIRDVLKAQPDDVISTLRPGWAEISGGTAPLYGDGNESMWHRKGVLAMAHILDKFLLFKVGVYGIGTKGETGGDLVINSVEGIPDFEIEVLTGTNNFDHWESKFRGLHDNPRDNWYIFGDRSTMCSFFNAMHRRTPFTLEGGTFSQPYSNWSAEAVNRKLRRSVPYDKWGFGIMAKTITSVLEADDDDLDKWLKEFYDWYDNPEFDLSKLPTPEELKSQQK